MSADGLMLGVTGHSQYIYPYAKKLQKYIVSQLLVSTSRSLLNYVQ